MYNIGVLFTVIEDIRNSAPNKNTNAVNIPCKGREFSGNTPTPSAQNPDRKIRTENNVFSYSF